MCPKLCMDNQVHCTCPTINQKKEQNEEERNKDHTIKKT